METLETASNSSMLSDGSEYPHSNVSSVSGLSSYEDELRELKRLINLDPIHDLKYSNKSPSSCSENSTYTPKVYTNNNSKLNHNIDWQNELENHRKIDKLIKHNAFLELELKSANERIRDILKNNITFSGNFNNANNIRNQILSLEKTNFDYNQQIQVLKKELLYWRDQLETTENSKRSVENELLEATQDNKSKATCIIELKKKICQLHTDIYNLKQENVKLNNQILSLENDADRLKKSEDWYKFHLHKNQAVKQDLLKECANLVSCNAAKSKEIELLAFELNKWKNSCDELKKALNEMKREHSIKYAEQIPPVETENEKLKIYYEAIISDLGNEIGRIKQSVQEHNIAFDKINQEKFQLVTQVTVLQKKLNKKEIAVHTLQNEKYVLNTQLSLVQENLNKSETNYVSVKNEKAAIEVELLALSKEKTLIEESVATIREDLNKLICKYKILQQKISSKDTYIKELEKEKYSLGKNSCNNDFIIILEKICFDLRNLCENNFEKHTNSLPNNSIIQSDKNVQNLLQSINAYIEKLCAFKKFYMEKQFCANTQNSNLHKALMSRLQKLENKCIILTKNNEESYNLLKLISSQQNSTNNIETENIKHLKAVIKANEIEMKEKQIRFETNNRTLLRKVKEHMLGRKQAEKRCVYLQELYDNMLSQYNMLRLRLSDMENEINIQAQNNNCILNNNVSNTALHCSECNSKCERIKHLEEELTTAIEKNEQVESKLQELTRKYSSLENKYTESLQKSENLQLDLTKCKETLRESEISLENTQKSLQNTQDELLEMANKNSEQTHSIKKYENLLKDVTEKNQYLLKEVESLSSNLHQKNEELSHLQQKHVTLREETSNFEATLTTLKSDLQNIQLDMNSVTNDKHFLQRICNDLKFALNSSINQNKVLKEQLQNLSSSRREYSSLPDEFLSLPNIAPTKYDDKYICKLLEQTSDPSHELLSSIQNNLHLLKQELSVLHMRINEKIFVGHCK